MPASNVFRNWTAVSFTSTPIIGVKDVSIDFGVQDIQDGADADRGPTHSVVSFENPTISVQTRNALALIAVAHGTKGVFTGIFNDSANGATANGGAYTLTTNALTYIAGRSQTGPYNTLGSQSLTFHTTWVDGVTNPISYAAVTA